MKGKFLLFNLLFSACLANADNLIVNGVVVTDSNKEDILKDGAVSFDAKSNTLNLNNLVLTSAKQFISTIEGTSGIQIDKTKELTINCEGESSIECSITDLPAISYQNTIVISGKGLLSLQSVTAGINCNDLHVNGGVAVVLSRSNIENTNFTLHCENLVVDNSTLIVKGNSKSYAMMDQMATFRGIGSWTEYRLMHKTVENRVRERYKYAYNASQHVWEYRYRTVSKYTHYDGWYNSNDTKARNVEIYQEAYPIWIKETQVDRYNLSNVLGDSKASYDPATRTLYVDSSIDLSEIKYDGLLKIKDIKDINDSKKDPIVLNPAGNADGMVSNTPSYPKYTNSYEDADEDEKSISVEILPENGDYVSYNLLEKNEVSEPDLDRGSISFDASTNTLTFNNAVIENRCIIYAKAKYLNIKLIGESYIKEGMDETISIRECHKLTISGDGYLCTRDFNTDCDSVIIKDGCKVEWMFSWGKGILTVDNATLDLPGDTIWNMQPLEGYYDLVLKNTAITPDSVSFKREYTSSKYSTTGFNNNCHFVNGDGISYSKGDIKIVPLNTSVPNVGMTQKYDALAPKYDLWGRPVNEGYKGVYIQSGRKFLNK